MRFPPGKVPPKALLDIVFKHLGAERPDVILGPSHGEDAAIVRSGKQLLAFSCDPISGALDRIGMLSVHVTTNDVATRGVKPSWFLSCILLPEGSGESILRTICKQMGKAAKKIGVSIVGGHSETTPGLNHPVVIGFAAGEVGRRGFVSCSGARPGGKIILTKGAGIEGTGILASDRTEFLAERYGKSFLSEARKFSAMTSVVEDAMIAFNSGRVQAMHDPTEGGVAGGLNEMATASRTGFRVYEELIEVAPETEKICRSFKVDPLKLASSGSLLIVAEEKGTATIVTRLRRKGIRSAVIGEVLSNRAKRILVKRDGREENLPLPYADELWAALQRPYG